MYALLTLQQRMPAVLLALFLVCNACPSITSGGIAPDGDVGAPKGPKSLVPKISSQRLIGTAVNKNPANSFAVIEDISNRQPWIFKDGDLVGDFPIKKILYGRIIVDRGRGEELLKLRRSQITDAAGGLRVPGKSARAPIVNPSFKNGLRSRHYLIGGKEVRAALADPDRLQRKAILRPVKLINR